MADQDNLRHTDGELGSEAGQIAHASMNQFRRAVPTVERGWVDDGLDVFGLLRVAFDQSAGGLLASANTTEGLARGTAWATYRRR